MQLFCVYACSVQCVKNVLQSIIVLFFTIHIVSGYRLTRDLPGVALVITFFTTLYTVHRKILFFIGAAVSQILMFPLEKHSIFVNIRFFCFECPSRFRL